jgi:phosphonate metabolism protein PhnN/1,5-bisphosphokinase (PRPP-forming)
MTEGRVFAVVGPSGAGKDMLLSAAKQALPDLHIARRVITRPESAGGEDFEGVTADEFERRRAAGDFALFWQAHGLSYGVPRAEFAALMRGYSVLFNGSRHGLAEAQARFPRLTVILVTAPAPVLAERLARRGRETPADIEARLRHAGFTLPPVTDLRVVQNDGTPEQGLARFLAALQSLEPGMIDPGL